jgi:predicted phage terminase large subunit-like protein
MLETMVLTSSPTNSSKVSGAFSADRAAAEAARRLLGCYAAWVHGYQPAAHHRVWIDKITELVEGRSRKRKLLLIAPPGCAKSTYVSLVLPAWYLGRYSDHSLLFFSSSDTMSRQFGGTVKLTLEGNQRHMLAFPGPMARPAIDRGWSVDGMYLVGAPAAAKDPSYRAAGYGASVVGARVHGIILDDPLDQAAAQSEIEQERARRYHDMTIDSRLHPGGWELAIMTRWHESDLAAHLMAKPDWDVVVMPALNDAGEALWPERFSVEWLHGKAADIGGALFACLYQGDPSALGGSIFASGSWFRNIPEDIGEHGSCQLVQFWDLAFSEKESADYTVGLSLATDYTSWGERRFHVVGVFRQRLSDLGLEEAMLDEIERVKPNLIGVEQAAYRTASTQDLVRRLNSGLAARGLYTTVMAVPVDRDKVTRARPAAARAESGAVFVDRSAPWWPAFEAECLAFPLGKHDDVVDALSGAVQLAIEKLGQPYDPQLQRQEYAFGGRR